MTENVQENFVDELFEKNPESSDFVSVFVYDQSFHIEKNWYYY